MVKKATKPAAKPAASNGKPRSAAEKKALSAHKLARWRPIADGATFKDQAFQLWLKRPTETRAIQTELAKKYPDGPTSWSKWLSGFATGRYRAGDPNYPRAAAKQIPALLKALKQTGGKLDANERKRLEKMAERMAS